MLAECQVGLSFTSLRVDRDGEMDFVFVFPSLLALICDTWIYP